MKLKEKLLNIKKELLLLIQPTSRDFEFNATLEDHPIVIKMYIDYTMLIIVEYSNIQGAVMIIVFYLIGHVNLL